MESKKINMRLGFHSWKMRGVWGEEATKSGNLSLENEESKN